VSEETDKEQIYTLPPSYVEAILGECAVQISTASELLKDLLSEKGELHNRDTVIPVVAELLWVNDSIQRRISVELDPPVYHHNKETEEDEYLLTEASILQLQNLMITRFMAVNELNRFSISICEH